MSRLTADVRLAFDLDTAHAEPEAVRQVRRAMMTIEENVKDIERVVDREFDIDAGKVTSSFSLSTPTEFVTEDD